MDQLILDALMEMKGAEIAFFARIPLGNDPAARGSDHLRAGHEPDRDHPTRRSS